MNWKERFKPDNNAEAGCYKIVLLVAFYVLLGAASSFFNISQTTLSRLFLAFFLLSMALIIAREIQDKYDISRIRALVLGIILTLVATVLLGAIVIGVGFLLFRLLFVPEQVGSIIFLAVLIALVWLGAKRIQPIKTLVYDRILNLPAKTSDHNLAG